MTRWKTEEELKEKYPLIPYHMLHSIVAYREHGQPEGGFGKSLLSNNLMGAFTRADIDNRKAMFQWVQLLFSDMPPGSFGSPEKYNEWCENGGLVGKQRNMKKENEND